MPPARFRTDEEGHISFCSVIHNTKKVMIAKMKGTRKNPALIVILISAAFIFFGYKIACAHQINATIQDYESELNEQAFAKVLQIDSVSQNPDDASTRIVKFTCVITSGQQKGQTVPATQYTYEENATMPPQVHANDRVVLGKLSSGGQTEWAFENYDRIRQIIILASVFVLLILLFGGKKGISTVLSLAITCLSIFYVFIPSILAGFNIYFMTVLICVFIIAVSFLLTGGANQKSLAAAVGCTGGVVFSGMIYVLMGQIMKLTGYYNNETSRLVQMFAQQPLNMKAIVFAMVTIGALGATMDVAMSIASSLDEIKSGKQRESRYGMVKSGLNIGKDIMGTMTNTLILAYIGSSLVMVVIDAASRYPLLQLLNKEEIIIEILESLIGSLGMLFTIPFTTVVSAFLLGRDHGGLESPARIQSKQNRQRLYTRYPEPRAGRSPDLQKKQRRQ